MTDRWFYRMFGEEFGPLPFENLKELAGNGTIHAFDQIRTEFSDNWVDAVTVDELGLSTSEHGPAIATSLSDLEMSILESVGGENTNSSTATATSLSDVEISTQQSGGEEWFCRMGGHELGPLSFDELLKFAEHEQLSADDDVKLGNNGKWRRAGSIGRLMAALPYRAVEKKIVRTPKPVTDRTPTEQSAARSAITSVAPPNHPAPAPAPSVPAPEPVAAPDPEATYRVAFEQATAKVVEAMLAQADATFKAAEEQAQAQIAWVKGPKVDQFWWGWAGGVEFGPVEFPQVFGLAKSGQLKSSDLVRNGQHGQYVPSANVPGMFKAIEMIAHASQARDLARAQAQAASALAKPPTVAPVALLNAAEKTVAAEKAAAAEKLAKSNPIISTQPATTPRSSPSMEAMRQPRPASDPQIEARDSDPEPVPARAETTRSPYSPSMSGGYSSSMGGGFASTSSSVMSTYGSGSNRPATIAPARPVARKPAVSESTWLPDLLESLKEPKAVGSLCAIAFVLMIVGWQFLPKSRAADLKRYQALKELLDDIKTKRTSSPADLMVLQQKLQKTGKEIAEELKGKASAEEPAKQCLLWAARDEVPRVIKSGLMMESPAEAALASRLKEASYELGLEKRPPVDLAQLAARANDD